MKISLGVTAVSSQVITDHQLVAADLWSGCWSLVTVICARAAGHCKTDEASPVSRWRGPSDAGISRPAAALCRLARPGPRQGSDYQFTLVRGSARQHINSDPRPTTQELTPWDSLPATDTRGGGSDQLWGIKIDISTSRAAARRPLRDDLTVNSEFVRN